MPVAYVLLRGFMAARNMPYWDEFDTAIALLLRLEGRPLGWELLEPLVAVTNEHRTVTSRLIFAASFWATGSVDFAVLSVIGNLFLCGAAVLLIVVAGTMARRLTMGLVLAALLFQLEHFESFFWAGSSIDHFQIVLLSVAALVGLSRQSRLGTFLGCLFAVLATLTLAHGLIVWPVGALMLAARERRTALRWWLGLALATGALFFTGYFFNGAHAIGGSASVGALIRVLAYWFQLIGAPVALGHKPTALVLGLVLLFWFFRLCLRGGWERERVALPVALWAILSLGLIAVGRVDVSHGELLSRYYVLGALAWAMAIFIQLNAGPETGTATGRSYRRLAWAVPFLVAFNVAADVRFSPNANTWVAGRDRALESFLSNGVDGAGPHSLHPNPARSTLLIKAAERRHVYFMPQRCHERTVPLRTTREISWAVDAVRVERDMVIVTGSARAASGARNARVNVLLRSAHGQRIFSTISPSATGTANAAKSREGEFRFEIRPERLPREDYELGVIVETPQGAGYVMTGARVDLTRGGTELGTSLVHANGNVFDHRLVRASLVRIEGSRQRITRLSFMDTDNDVVHVEFSGAGRLTLAMEDSTGPKVPPGSGAAAVAYMQGRASLTIEDANRSTHLAVFTAVRRARRPSARPVGIADIASITIRASDGRFGSLRTANVRFGASSGFTGVFAPGVRFQGPVWIGDIQATGSATPMIALGWARDVHVTGGNLFQPNGQPVQLSGVEGLQFVDGSTSGGIRLPAKVRRGAIQRIGQSVAE